MIYLSIRKETGVVTGMGMNEATCWSMLDDAKIPRADYVVVPFSDRDFQRWVDGQKKES